HALTGGRWGEAIRPALEGAARLVPLVAVLFAPVLVDEAGRPWLAARSVAYLGIWCALAHALLHAAPRRRSAVAAGGLIAYGLTMSLAAVDWIAALTPGWHSSGFGLVVVVGQMLGSMAFAVAAARRQGRMGGETGGDLGNLLLMYVLVWAYLAYTQFLIIWAENLPREISWY